MVEMLKDMGLTMEVAVEYIAMKLKMNIEEVYEIAKAFEAVKHLCLQQTKSK